MTYKLGLRGGRKGTGTICAERPATNLRSVPGFAQMASVPDLPDKRGLRLLASDASAAV